MKKIAILGCSFSDWYSDEHENWSHHIAKNFPDTEVHCYAHQATGQDFFDYTIDYILAEKSYDCVIYQVSMPSRITIPIHNPLNPHMEREWNVRSIEKPGLDNFKQYRINHDIVSFNRNSICPDCVEGLDQSWDMDKLKNSLQYFHSLNNSTSEYFKRRYVRHIQNLDNKYTKLFDNFFWYIHHVGINSEQYLNTIGIGNSNIGQRQSTLNFMIDNYGKDPVWFYENIVIGEEDHHFTAYGNKLLYEEYILKSRIGEYLND